MLFVYFLLISIVFLLFVHSFEDWCGGSLSAIDGFHPVNKILDELVLLPFIFEDEIYLSVLESQADALPSIKWKLFNLLVLKTADVLP